MGRWFGAVALGAGICSGCTLLTDLTGLRDPEVVGSPDGDGGIAGDAGPGGGDATPNGDATTGSSFCATKTATACEDFEPLGAGWKLEARPGGFAEVKPDPEAISSPNLLSTRGLQGSQTGRGLLVRSFGSLTATVRVSCMMRVDPDDRYTNGVTLLVSGSGETLFAQTGFQQIGTSNDLEVFVEKYGRTRDTKTVGTLPRRKWERINLELTTAGGTGSMTVSFAGNTRSVDVLSGDVPSGANVEVQLGVFYTRGDSTISYDDCTFDLQ
ncbi:MAG: hypothetical protein KF819_20040 [Labilithrix sp.]|nr:hypothetical protein [Labilithrix sp.]